MRVRDTDIKKGEKARGRHMDSHTRKGRALTSL